jgi:hypothetical protein
MSIYRKTAAVLLATTAFCGIGSMAAVAFADTPATAPAAAQSADQNQVGKVQYSRGFHFTNLSGDTATLTSISGDNQFEGNAPVGSVLKPGIGLDDFEVTFLAARNDADDITYAMTDASGHQDGSVTFHVNVDAFGTPTAGVGAVDGPFQLAVNGANITVLDPPGTVHTISGDDAQAQAATLKQFCSENTAAQCTFTPTSETHVDGPEHVLVTEENNGTNPAVLTATKGDTVSSSDSLEVDGTVGVNILDIVNASVTLKYGHSWGESHTFDTGVSNTVPAGYYGEITAIAPMIRDTGDFSISMGNTTWNLTGVHFDSPEQDGAEHFGYHEHPLSQQQLDTLPKSAVVHQA